MSNKPSTQSLSGTESQLPLDGAQDLPMIAEFLSDAYWGKGIPIQIVQKPLEDALCFTVLKKEQQIGFARVTTDYVSFACLGDIFILPEYRGLALEKRLIECIRAHPRLQGLRRWLVATRDTKGLYAQYGFEPLSQGDVMSER